ncbi:hypothetical protein LEP1GSC158_2097 [Leptospira interrogans serovar Zanoni str. LT2156]|uniref:Uncharacterized protein n=1 Tax=Leptospira interrogans serovar Zanoni str. LT2156 TaxID=1001601 RepID=M6HB82_LEPIR|nr:hypothetical protein LEP1GSC158_2097 [Leptospira interrogans serovar Zanoni str. LT2156]
MYKELIYKKIATCIMIIEFTKNQFLFFGIFCYRLNFSF